MSNCRRLTHILFDPGCKEDLSCCIRFVLVFGCECPHSSSDRVCQCCGGGLRRKKGFEAGGHWYLPVALQRSRLIMHGKQLHLTAGMALSWMARTQHRSRHNTITWLRTRTCQTFDETRHIPCSAGNLSSLRAVDGIEWIMHGIQRCCTPFSVSRLCPKTSYCCMSVMPSILFGAAVACFTSLCIGNLE